MRLIIADRMMVVRERCAEARAQAGFLEMVSYTLNLMRIQNIHPNIGCCWYFCYTLSFARYRKYQITLKKQPAHLQRSACKGNSHQADLLLWPNLWCSVHEGLAQPEVARKNFPAELPNVALSISRYVYAKTVHARTV